MTAPYEAVVIGASAGCVEALSRILPALPGDYPLPVMIVVHLPPNKESVMASLLAAKCAIPVREAEDKEPIKPGHVYMAPADYHMLVEYNGLLSLSNEEEVLFSRPSIDVLFESAADAYGRHVIGVILTGANNDGAHGLSLISGRGGLCLVQDPQDAYASIMPESAVAAVPDSKIMDIPDIIKTLLEIGEETKRILAEENKKNRKVLVVDDDISSAQTISWMLESLGYEPVIANSGKDAIDIAAREKPRVMFLDITLPDISGLEVCRTIKSDPHLEHIFIAAQTGWSAAKDRQAALDAGFDEYLVKPVSMEDYAALLKKTFAAV